MTPPRQTIKKGFWYKYGSYVVILLLLIALVLVIYVGFLTGGISYA